MIAHPGTPLASLFCLAWTVALYFAIKPFYLRRPRIWLSPAIVVPALTIALLLAAHIPYAAYVADTRWMVWLLGPATIAFAVPIYEHRAIVRRHWLALALGVVAGTLVAMVSARLLAQAFHFNTEITRSLMARSVSTPFAVAVVSRTGGSADLVSLFTVMTGLVGMIVGYTLLLHNRGDTPAQDVLVRGIIGNAGAQQQALLQSFFAQQSGLPLHSAMAIMPGETRRLTGELRLMPDEIVPVTMGQRSLLIPLAAFDASYHWGPDGGEPQGHGRTARAFILGQEQEPPADRLAPFRLDQGPRQYRRPATRAAGELVPS